MLTLRVISSGSAAAQSEIAWIPPAPLALPDRSASVITIDAQAAALTRRDQVLLLWECRRALRPGGTLHCTGREADSALASLAPWAELVGLVELPAGGTVHGWSKRAPPQGKRPLVSILIPTANPRYFLQCLDSALAQSYPNIEIVVCDDCDSDDIARLAASRAGRRGLQYHKNTPRLHARKNYARLLELAQGEYIKYLNDDDLLAPQCVASMVDAFERIPDVTLVTSHRWRIDERSQVIADMPATLPVVGRDSVIEGLSLANAVIMHGLNFIGEPSTMMFRRSDFAPRPRLDGERPFHFNGEEVTGAIDYAMFSRMLVQGNAVFLKKRLSSFRKHGEQAQARPEVVGRSVDGIRGLQRMWIELGLFRRFPPHVLNCQPLSRSEAQASLWQPEVARSLPAPPLPVDEAIRQWRATAKHPFE